MNHLLHHHFEAVFGLALKKTGDDIVQEIFISLWENRSTLGT